ncbi:hypothetical protein [Acidiphilium sp.]|uniref:hypothetical protein n=1 Tax=Acidiphilium sp. TaxID=527 RepID=UPI00258BE257|nr:hypothetical protein [Acidiphilium sp.]
MGNTSSGTESVTQKQEPWSAAQPYLQNIFGQAQQLYNKGSEYFPGSTVVPFNGDTEAGLQQLRSQFQAGPVGLDDAISATRRVAGGDGGGLNPFTQDMRDASGKTTTAGSSLIKASANANPYTQGIIDAAGRANTAGSDTLQQFASANVNPYLDAMFDRASAKVRDGTNAMFSKAGRFGSTANQETLTEGLNDLATSMYGSAYETDANRRFAAAEALGAREAGDISRQLSGAATVAGLGESEFGRKAAAGSTLSGIEANDLSRQLSALGVLGGYGEASLDRDLQANGQALQAAALMPTMGLYSQSGARGLIEIGGVREAQAGNELQDLIDRWNFSQNAGWDNLARYNAAVQPIAGLGSSSTTTQPAQSKFGSAMQGGVGGAMAGSAFGPWGAAIGGGLGVLGSIF